MIVDDQLVRRLEAGAARDTLRVAERMHAAVGIAFGDGALLAMGAGRYVNRAMGVTTDELSAADLGRIEDFYTQRRLPPMIEVSAWAAPATVQRLADRQYTTRWFRSMFAVAAQPLPSSNAKHVTIEEVTDDTVGLWTEVLADGNEITDDEARRVSDEFSLAGRGMAESNDFLALIDGRPVGCGSLHVVDGIGWLGGAATLPSHRGRGVQTALLGHRLQLAAARGCEMVAATALPSGASARNMHRLGFTHVQTQAVVARDTEGP